MPPYITCEMRLVPPVVRGSGLTELNGDVLVICDRRPDAPIATGSSIQLDVSAAYNTNVTNNIDFGLGATTTDAVLDFCLERISSFQVPSGGCSEPNPNAQDPQYGVLVENNRLEWRNVVFPVPGADPDGDGPLPQNPRTIMRITSVATNPTQFGIPGFRDVPDLLSNNVPIAFLAVDPPWSIGLEESSNWASVQILGQVGGSPEPPKPASTELCPGSEFEVGITVEEGFATAFKTNGVATLFPANTQFEAGYPAPGSNGGDGVLHGTRLLIRFEGVPTGVKLEVPAKIDLGDPQIATDALELTVIDDPDSDGSGGTISSAVSRLAVPIQDDRGTVVFEVSDADSFRIERLDIPVWISRDGDDSVATGTIYTKVTFAPTSAVDIADLEAPERRFVTNFRYGDAVEITRCLANNLAPEVDAGEDRLFEVAEVGTASVKLAGSATDPEGDPIVLTWRGPFGTADGATPTVNLGAGGHTLILTADDGLGGIASDTVTMTVRELYPRLEFRPRELRFELPVGAAAVAKPVVLQAVDGGLPFTVRPGGSWVSVSPASGSLERDETVSVSVTVDPTGLRAGTYQSRVFVRSRGETVGTIAVAMALTGDEVPVGRPLPEVSRNGVVNAASLSAHGQPGHPVSPGSMVSIFGTNFSEPGEHFEAIGTPLPTTLGGVTVRFNGIAAPLFGVWPGQINAQLPSGLDAAALTSAARTEQAAGVSVVVETAAGLSEAQSIGVARYSPAIFTTSQEGTGQAVAVVNNTSILAAPVGFNESSRPANPAELLAIYATGLGPVTPPVADGTSSCAGAGCGPDTVLRHTTERPVVMIGGSALPDEDVLFSGLAPEFVGVYMVIVRMPGIVVASDAVPVQLEIGGVSSRDGVTIAAGEILGQ
jgi:uncharacterized protein (TIGR03437 family)